MELVAGEPIEVGSDVGLVAEIGIDGFEPAAEADELLDEGLADPAAVLIVEIEHGAALHAEPLARPVRQRGAVREVAGADAEGVVAGGGHLGRGGRGRDRRDGIGAAVVDGSRSQGGAGEQVPHHRGHVGIVEVVGHEYRGVWVGVVIPRHDLEPPAVDSAGGVDLLGGQLGGAASSAGRSGR